MVVLGWYWCGGGVVMVKGMLVLGVFFHVWENLIWYYGVVGFMGKVSICVFVVCFNMSASSCGVCLSMYT